VSSESPGTYGISFETDSQRGRGNHAVERIAVVPDQLAGGLSDLAVDIDDLPGLLLMKRRGVIQEWREFVAIFVFE